MLRRAGIIRSVERKTSPDVVVIGGGIIGTSVAAFLAEAGRRVVLVERAEIGAGASGRNSGVVQHPFDPALVALHLETVTPTGNSRTSPCRPTRSGFWA